MIFFCVLASKSYTDAMTQRPVKLWASNTARPSLDAARTVLEDYHADDSRTVGKNAPAVVFDADETLLLNHEDDDSGMFAPNGGVVALYNQARDLGIPAYVVTARRKSPWAASYLRRQLSRIGVDDVERVYMVNRAYDDDESASRFKMDARRRIRDHHGHRILLNVGDQVSDHLLVGPYATAETTAMEASLRPKRFYGLLPRDGVSLVSLKLPSSYTVN